MIDDQHATLAVGAGGLPVVQLRTPAGATATVYLYGAHVTSWVPASGGERLYLSEQAVFRPGAAIRGGIPVVFPQFADQGPLTKHGFARLRPWTLERVETQPGQTVARLALAADAETRTRWPHDWRAELQVALGDTTLAVELAVVSRQAQPLSFTAALHTYLRVAEVSAVAVGGLGGTRFHDKVTGTDQVQTAAELTFAGEVDRVYPAAPAALVLRDGAQTLRVARAGFADWVVWNPGAAKGAALADLAPADDRRFVCIEAAAAAAPVVLAAGERWAGRQELRAG